MLKINPFGARIDITTIDSVLEKQYDIFAIQINLVKLQRNYFIISSIINWKMLKITEQSWSKIIF